MLFERENVLSAESSDRRVRAAAADEEAALVRETLTDVCGIPARVSADMIRLATRFLDVAFVDGALHRPRGGHRYLFVALSLVLVVLPADLRGVLDHSILFTLSGFGSHREYTDAYLSLARNEAIRRLIYFSTPRKQ